jgi:hypothetical protein
MKKVVVITLTCLTTSLYADLGDDYNTCLKQLEKTGMPVHHFDRNGYPGLGADGGSGIPSVTLLFNKAKTHCIYQAVISPNRVQVNLMKVTLAPYHKHWKIDNVDDSNVWAESTDGQIYVTFSLNEPGSYQIVNREARQSPLVNWPNRENPEKESMLFP